MTWTSAGNCFEIRQCIKIILIFWVRSEKLPRLSVVIKTSWSDNVSRSREFCDLRLKTKSWNFEEGRRRPKSPKESLKKALSSIELSCNQLSLFAYFRKNVRKVRASCLVDVETEHELKAVRKRDNFLCIWWYGRKFPIFSLLLTLFVS